MENKIYLQKLFNKKAEENNTIDLNAYALGLIDSKANEMLHLLKKLSNHLLHTTEYGFVTSITKDVNDSLQLIKETENI